METPEFLCNKFGIDPKTLNPKKMPHVINPFDRTELAKMFHELGFTTGVEVGVERGKYAECLLTNIPGLTLYGVDPWTTYDGYVDYVDQGLVNAFYKEMLGRTKRFPNFKIVREFSVEAATKFKDESIDFVYIDGNHDLLNVLMDLTAWIPKIRKGGVISGHDYVPQWKSQLDTIHVQAAVQAWTGSYHVFPWFAFPGGSTRLHRHGSFFWVK